MLATRTFSFSPLLEMRRELDRLFQQQRCGCRTAAMVRPFPAVNVWEDGDCFFVEAEVPGLRMDDLELTVLGNQLLLKGQWQHADANDHVYHRRERDAGEFRRKLTLPAEVNTDKVEATLQDGILTIKLPKAEAARRRKIEVTSS